MGAVTGPAAATTSRPRAGLLAGLLPAAAAAAESFGEAGGCGQAGGCGPGPASGTALLPAEAALFPAEAALFPAEAALVRTAGAGRRAEFAAGRRCAHAALGLLGLPAVPITSGPAGEPRWPPGVAGSITHCPGYQACAVALAGDVPAIGIDAEPDAGLPPGLLESVAAGPDRARIARQAAVAPGVHWDRLLFSVKEAAAKLWYPLTGQWLAFGDLTVGWPAEGSFAVRVRGTGPGIRLAGRWLARGGLIVTAAAWAPGSADREGPASFGLRPRAEDAPVGFGDRHVVDAGLAPLHQPVGVEFP